MARSPFFVDLFCCNKIVLFSSFSLIILNVFYVIIIITLVYLITFYLRRVGEKSLVGFRDSEEALTSRT